MKRMPFSSEREARVALDECWHSLKPADFLEAFQAHPQIGDKEALRNKYAKSSSGWEAEEQSGVRGASEVVVDELAQLNKVYMSRNGFVFLICATGKTAEEILAALKLRLTNDRDTEIITAAEEQRKITQLRFTKLLDIAAERRSEGNCTYVDGMGAAASPPPHL
ncbi:unnamed protein product [Discosporangium mesarthrocarpum]